MSRAPNVGIRASSAAGEVIRAIGRVRRVTIESVTPIEAIITGHAGHPTYRSAIRRRHGIGLPPGLRSRDAVVCGNWRPIHRASVGAITIQGRSCRYIDGNRGHGGDTTGTFLISKCFLSVLMDSTVGICCTCQLKQRHIGTSLRFRL
jgi:hypothetical protein